MTATPAAGFANGAGGFPGSIPSYNTLAEPLNNGGSAPVVSADGRALLLNGLAYSLPSPVSLYQIAASNDYTVVTYGSSSTQHISNGVTPTIEYADSYWFAAQATHGYKFSLLANRGVSGKFTVDIMVEQFRPNIAASSAKFNIGQLASNDLAAGQTTANLKTYVEEFVTTSLRYGKKVILIVPHMRNPSPYPRLEYERFAALCWDYVRRFPGLVYVADHFAIANRDGRDTPAAWLLDGTHLSLLGTFGVAPAWDWIYASVFGIADPELPAFQVNPLVPATNIMPPSGWAGVSATIGVGDPDQYGRASARVAQSGAGNGTVSVDDTSLTVNEFVRFFADIKTVTCATSAAGGGMGAYARAGDQSKSYRIGADVYNDIINPLPVGLRLRIMSPKILVTAAMDASTRLVLSVGNAGNSMDAYGCAMFRVPA